MWVRFTSEFRWKPTPVSAKVYPAGWIENVPRACGEAAIAAGKAEPTDREGVPKRPGAGAAKVKEGGE
jgi:hypothetical protein